MNRPFFVSQVLLKIQIGYHQSSAGFADCGKPIAIPEVKKMRKFWHLQLKQERKCVSLLALYTYFVNVCSNVLKWSWLACFLSLKLDSETATSMEGLRACFFKVRTPQHMNTTFNILNHGHDLHNMNLSGWACSPAAPMLGQQRRMEIDTIAAKVQPQGLPHMSRTKRRWMGLLGKKRCGQSQVNTSSEKSRYRCKTHETHQMF
jgi:hypothetical protein